MGKVRGFANVLLFMLPSLGNFVEQSEVHGRKDLKDSRTGRVFAHRFTFATGKMQLNLALRSVRYPQATD